MACIQKAYIDYVHTVSFSLAFYIVLRPQGIRKQMKTLRKRHRAHIALKRNLVRQVTHA